MNLKKKILYILSVVLLFLNFSTIINGIIIGDSNKNDNINQDYEKNSKMELNQLNDNVKIEYNEYGFGYKTGDFGSIRRQLYYQPMNFNGKEYEISNIGQLYWFSQEVNRGNIMIKKAKIKLLNDINFDLNLPSWEPIGQIFEDKKKSDEEYYLESYFEGEFDGCGHKIIGIRCIDPRKNDVGLFGIIGAEGIVRNVTIERSFFQGNECVGAICGRNNGKIENCVNTSYILGKFGVGGIAGLYNEGQIINCNNNGMVVGEDIIGGIVGLLLNKEEAEDNEIKRCKNFGEIRGKIDSVWVGGIIGVFAVDERNDSYEGKIYKILLSCTDESGCYKGYLHIQRKLGQIIEIK